jgi:EmrB/QacA subfamily drug resistance transporter
MSQASSPAGPHDHRPPDPGERKPWTVLALVALVQFMVILDVTVVNVALPSIREGLEFAAGDLQWVVTAYVLFTGGLMLLGGRLADYLGRERVFIAGLGVFTAASLASGVAWSSEALIVSRALQGVGAALLLPSGLAIVTTHYEGAQRAKALAVWGALGSAGAAAGVLLGGVLTAALSWRWIFFVNVPVGIAVGLAATAVIGRGTRPAKPAGALDVLGAVALMSGLVALVYGIEGTGTHGWGSARTLLLYAASAVLLAAFVAVERRAERPLVPPATWRVRSLVSSSLVLLGATGVLVGAFFLNTLFLQDVLGASALETGLAFLPLVLVILAGTHVASQVLPRVGTRAVVAGGLVLAALGALRLSAAPADASYVADLLPGFVVLGLGLGLVFVGVSITAMTDVGHENAGLASGILTTAHELGAAVGVAVLSAVATAAGSGSLSERIVDGYGDGFLVAAGVAGALAVVTGLSVPSIRPAASASHGLH